MSRTTLPLAGAGAILLALTAAGLWLDLPYVDVWQTRAQRQSVVALLAVASLVYLAAVAIVLKHESSRRTVWLVVAVAALMRLAFLFEPPVLSTDMYRYVWDGQVQKAGINPYRYIPADPALKHLRDAQIFPLINRSNYAPTIYAPAAQAVFAFVGRITSTVTGMKIAMVGFELLACLCMLQLLKMVNLPAERILIYAWNPMAQWSFAYDGHVDAVAIGFLGVALLYRARHRTALAGAFLACAALVKFIPLVVAPAFVRGGTFWRPALAGILTIGGLYALYSSVGMRVFGFMTGYPKEEGLADGTGLWLLNVLSVLGDATGWFTLPGGIGKYYLAAAVAVMALLGLWIARRRLKPGETDIGILCRDTAILAAVTLMILNPHYPWYFVWLALPSVIAPVPAVIWMSVAPLILYLPATADRPIWGTFVFVPAIALAALSWWNNRARRSVYVAPA